MTWDHKYKSLGELVYDRIESRTAIGPEWDQLCKWFGFAKLEELYEQEKIKRQSVPVKNPENYQEPKTQGFEW
jgi:hypothetical protein